MFKRRWRIRIDTIGNELCSKELFTPEMKWPLLPWTDLLNGLTETPIIFDTLGEAKVFIDMMEKGKKGPKYIYYA